MKLSLFIVSVLFCSSILAIQSACDDSGKRDGSSDSDSDSDIDTDACDCPDLGGISPDELAAAINLCPGDEEFTANSYWSSANGALGVDILPYLGNNPCMQRRHGCQMIALSTGPVGQDNPNDAQDMGDEGAQESLDPMPEFQGHAQTDGFLQLACDVTQLQLTLEAPAWAYGFSFDFLFASSEYDEWMNSGYNDTFYAILELPSLNGGASTNIAFDQNGYEIEVDSNYFENNQHPCDETGSGWSPDVEDVSGSTGWLRTEWPVMPGDSFDLTFSIHDEGDCIYDSIVFIDAFTWLETSPSGITIPIE